VTSGAADRRRAACLGALAVVVALASLVVPSVDAATGPRPPVDHLTVTDSRIVDGQGRAVLLRGVNVNQLGDYFRPNPAVPSTLPFSRSDLERIASLGMNTVRLLVHWSRLEPEPGVRDDGYLAEIRQAVEWAEELGLWVVLDMHQDAWGKHIATEPGESCPPPLSPATGWDGAPAWATFTDGLTRCRLALREASPAVAQAFESFWLDRPAADGTGIQQHLVETWAWLADAFEDTPTVVGYDLLNEPHPGWTPVLTDVIALGEYHRRALDAIRRAEHGGLTKIVFSSPWTPGRRRASASRDRSPSTPRSSTRPTSTPSRSTSTGPSSASRS
jgi:endoglycosylceramidase